MTGIEMLRDVCKALKGSPWCGTDIATIGGEPAYEKLSKIADKIERETLPRPRFEDGEPVQFGDEFVSCDGPRVVVGIKYSCEGGISLCDADGELYRFVGRERVKRPEPPKVLDADGVEIKVGDEVWGRGREQHAYKVLEPASDDEYAYGRFTVKCIDLSSSEQVVYADPSSLTHKRPEPPDTWESIEADSKKHYCAYFGRAGMFECAIGERYACPLSELDDECETLMAQNLVRRCKALAGVE